MQQQDLEQRLNSYAEMLFDARLTELSCAFSYPVNLWSNHGAMTLADQGRLVDALSLYHEVLEHQNVASMRAKVLAVPFPGGSVSTVWVRWQFLDAAGDKLFDETVRYVLTHEAISNHPLISGMGYGDVALAELISPQVADEAQRSKALL